MRVACALESLLHISPKTRLLIDDYVGRSYAAVEEFATLVAFHGTMAEFRKREVFDEVACARVLKLAYSDMR
jgi:hypothetical protein